MMNWDGYGAMCKEQRIDNPYENEEHYNRAYGIIKTVDLPLRITPKKPTVKKSLTVEKSDHIPDVGKKITPPKKPKA